MKAIDDYKKKKKKKEVSHQVQSTLKGKDYTKGHEYQEARIMGAVLVAVYCTDHVRSQGNKLEWAPTELAIQGNLIINKITIIIDYDAVNFFIIILYYWRRWQGEEF